MQKYSVNQQLIQNLLTLVETFKIAMQDTIKRMLIFSQQHQIGTFKKI